jgi:hypothetical protein
MSDQLESLAKRIRNEVVELKQVAYRVETGWQRAKRSGDDYYLDGVALNLHGFYNGLERIFERIAAVLDGTLPQGENWHQLLLNQMMAEVPGVRPAVISRDTCKQLDEFRGFRHIVRNVYTFKFNPLKLEKLVVRVNPLFSQIRLELLAFADFLEKAQE